MLSPGSGNKKYSVIYNGRKIQFGDKRYSDYTQHHDSLRKEAYIKRHSANENWDDPNTAGFWARWVLWNKKTIAESLSDIKKKFGIVV